MLKLVLVLALIFFAPALIRGWSSVAAPVLESAMRSALPDPSVSVSSAAPTVFPDCRELQTQYPRPDSRNAGRPMQGLAVGDLDTYRANRSLARDRDGIACEVPAVP